MTVSMHRTLVALKLPTSAPALVVYADSIVVAMTSNAYFPSPSPSLGKVAAAIAELRTAAVNRQTGTRGTATTKNTRRAAVVSLLHRLKAYVQGVADDDPDSAGSIIESAGMSIKKSGRAPKPLLRAKPGKVKGWVELWARSVGREATYQWAWSTDGGKTWHAASPTLSANTVLKGLQSGVTHWFRFMATTRKSRTNWCDPVEFIVP
jgi:hypothetical protein